MLTSSRRSLSYPNTNRSDTADVPRDINVVIQALELDVVFSQGTHASRPAAGSGAPAATGGGRLYWETDTSGLFYDNGTAWIGPINNQGIADGSVTLAKLAANSVDGTKIVDGSVNTAELANGSVTGAKINSSLSPAGGAGASTEALRALGTAAGMAAPGTLVPQAGTLASRPTASSSLNGLFYYATDQASLSLVVGGAWVRVGEQAGDIIWTAESAARTGYILLQGQAWPSTTGIYADLFSKLGGAFPANLPDLQGRALIALGTHVDVDVIGDSDGLSVASRRPKHKHTVVGGSGLTGGGGFGSGSSGNTLTPITVGPQTGAEPTDAPAYIALQPQAKL